MEMGEAFQFKTPSCILVVGPSGYGRTCFKQVLLLQHLNELFADVTSSVAYCYGAWQDKFVPMKTSGVIFYKGVPDFVQLKAWFPNGGLLILNDLIAEGKNDKEVLDLFT